jgi:hypothetical protein
VGLARKKAPTDGTSEADFDPLRPTRTPSRVDMESELNRDQARAWIASARKFNLTGKEVAFLAGMEADMLVTTWSPTVREWNRLNDLAEGY